MRTIRIKIVTSLVIFFLVSLVACDITFAYAERDRDVETNFDRPIVLVTGFEPFNTYEVNPAQLIAEKLDTQEVKGAIIVGISVPVEFNESIVVVTQAIETYNPIIVISIGLEANICSLHIEKIGLNLKRLSNDEEKFFKFQKIDPYGPIIRFSSLPIRCITKAIRKNGIPARQSVFAGTYVCNTLLYGVLSYVSKNELSIKAGFIHVPLLKSQDPKNGMELDTMIEAVKTAITVGLE